MLFFSNTNDLLSTVLLLSFGVDSGDTCYAYETLSLDLQNESGDLSNKHICLG